MKTLIDAIDKNDRKNDAFFDKIYVKVVIKLYSIKAILGLFDDALYLCDQLNEFKDYIEDIHFNQILKDREVIEKRKNSEVKKVEKMSKIDYRR